MYEDITYEVLLARMMQRALSIRGGLDTREGSLIHLGQAPAAVELQNLYIALDNVLRESFASTASREYLILRAGERGLVPYSATPAMLRLSVVPASLELDMNTRFSIGACNYGVTDNLGNGDYELTCETAGEAGNAFSGPVLPIDHIEGLERCTVTGLLIPGEDEEDTEAFRARYFRTIGTQAFAGNQADYAEKVNAIPGVGAVKVHPVWNEGIAPASLIPGEAVEVWYEAAVGGLEAPVAAWLTAVYEAARNKCLTVGGVVRLVIMASDYSAPTDTLIDAVQAAVDPTQNAGEGLGIAPIGHVVRVEGVGVEPVDVSLNLTYAAGWNWEAAKSYVEAVIDSYFQELAQGWERADCLVVRISQIESRVLAGCAEMISDIGGTKLNGTEGNLTLGPDQIPARGTVYG